jgi:hypothetical protein
MRLLPAIYQAHQAAVSFTEEELPSFNLVMLYDHEFAAEAARRIVSGLLGRCLPETDMHEDCWRFEEMAHAQFRQEAWELAKACDLMVLVTMNEEHLPLEVCSWVDQWTRTRSESDAALVFLRISTERYATTPPLPCGLETAPNLAVFTGTFSLPDSKQCFISPEPAFAASTPYSRIPDRWGINE